MKSLVVFFDMLTVVLLMKLAGSLGMNKGHILLYAWSPIPIMYFGLDGHVDALGIFLLILFLLLMIRHRVVASALALGASALAKVHPLFLAAFLFRPFTGARRIVLPLIPLVVFAAGCWFYYEPTGGLTESFAVFSSTWDFNGSLFRLLWLALGSNELAHLFTGALFAALVIVLALADRPIIDKVFLGFLGMMLLSPVVHPWYLTWLAALIVVRWSPAAFVLLGLSNLSNITVYHYRLTGEWAQEPWLLVVEYLPVFILIGREIVRGDFTASGTIPAGAS